LLAPISFAFWFLFFFLVHVEDRLMAGVYPPFPVGHYVIWPNWNNTNKPRFMLIVRWTTTQAHLVIFTTFGGTVMNRQAQPHWYLVGTGEYSQIVASQTLNYHPNATLFDGSCILPELCILPCKGLHSVSSQASTCFYWLVCIRILIHLLHYSLAYLDPNRPYEPWRSQSFDPTFASCP